MVGGGKESLCPPEHEHTQPRESTVPPAPSIHDERPQAKSACYRPSINQSGYDDGGRVRNLVHGSGLAAKWPVRSFCSTAGIVPHNATECEIFHKRKYRNLKYPVKQIPLGKKCTGVHRVAPALKCQLVHFLCWYTVSYRKVHQCNS